MVKELPTHEVDSVRGARGARALVVRSLKLDERGSGRYYRRLATHGRSNSATTAEDRARGNAACESSRH